VGNRESLEKGELALQGKAQTSLLRVLKGQGRQGRAEKPGVLNEKKKGGLVLGKKNQAETRREAYFRKKEGK